MRCCAFSLFSCHACASDSSSVNEAHGSAAHHLLLPIISCCPSSPLPIVPSAHPLVPISCCPSLLLDTLSPFFSGPIQPRSPFLLFSLRCFLSFRWRRQIAKSNPSPACQVLLFPCASPSTVLWIFPQGKKAKKRAFFIPFPLFCRQAQEFVGVVLPVRSSAHSLVRKGMFS